MPEPRPNVQHVDRARRTPRQAAIARFCVTARTCRPERGPLQHEPDERAAAMTKPMTPMRFQGSTRPGAARSRRTARGVGHRHVLAPKSRRMVWMRSRLMPQVASSVSSGRP